MVSAVVLGGGTHVKIAKTTIPAIGPTETRARPLLPRGDYDCAMLISSGVTLRDIQVWIEPNRLPTSLARRMRQDASLLLMVWRDNLAFFLSILAMWVSETSFQW